MVSRSLIKCQNSGKVVLYKYSPVRKGKERNFWVPYLRSPGEVLYLTRTEAQCHKIHKAGAQRVSENSK